MCQSGLHDAPQGGLEGDLSPALMSPYLKVVRANDAAHSGRVLGCDLCFAVDSLHLSVKMTLRSLAFHT